MKIQISKAGQYLVVTRDPGDPKFYGVKNAAGESKLFHRIKNQLNQMGLDCIKKRMQKDGHLHPEMQQYIRDKNGKWCFYNGHWQIDGADVDFNKGRVILLIGELRDGGFDDLLEKFTGEII